MNRHMELRLFDAAGEGGAPAAAENSVPAGTETPAPAAETDRTQPEEPTALEVLRARRAGAARRYAAARVDGWRRAADELRAQCPDFDLAAALGEGAFCAMLRAGVPLEQAWFALHARELLSSAAAHAGRAAEQRVAEHVRVRGLRPAENGLGSGGGIVVRPDVSRMSRADRAEVARRAARGERVAFPL